MVPVNPIVEALVGLLDDNLREAFEERAGILQFEANHPREMAECLALLLVIREHPLAVSEVTAHVIRHMGRDEYVLRTGHEEGEGRSLDLTAQVKEWGGIALLVPKADFEN
jgi:hypothetical protein